MNADNAWMNHPVECDCQPCQAYRKGWAEGIGQLRHYAIDNFTVHYRAQFEQAVAAMQDDQGWTP